MKKKFDKLDKMIVQKSRQNKGKKFVKYCPDCGSTDYEVLSIYGYSFTYGNIFYRCKKCNYVGVLPEKSAGTVK